MRSPLTAELISNPVEEPKYPCARCVAAGTRIFGFYGYLTGFDMNSHSQIEIVKAEVDTSALTLLKRDLKNA